MGSANPVYIPREIRAGYQNRPDTYSGKLGYVVAIDHTGKTRKETSWLSWTDEKIGRDTFENVPTSGFVLNKHAGGARNSWSSWNTRADKMRVYDPRGFEIELSVDAILYILENANSIKGKGLEGDFVYGWNGVELCLIPVEAPEYAELVAYRDMLYDKTTIKAKDLVLGATYAHKSGRHLVYLGRHGAYKINYRSPSQYRGKMHFFRWLDDRTWSTWEIGGQQNHSAPRDGSREEDYIVTSSISGLLVKAIDEEPVKDFAHFMDELENSALYSSIDDSKSQFPLFIPAELVSAFDSHYGDIKLYTSSGRKLSVYRIDTNPGYWGSMNRKPQWTFEAWDGHQARYSVQVKRSYNTIEALIEAEAPCHKDTYLANDKFYQREV